MPVFQDSMSISVKNRQHIHGFSTIFTRVYLEFSYKQYLFAKITPIKNVHFLLQRIRQQTIPYSSVGFEKNKIPAPKNEENAYLV